ncbi:MAG: NADAR family protein [Gomphosphaeria aponina SAG 52.96 = DSM 107014]|uniref:NADAR family protein n=1 Tax=Gomphosphaeria aponina SAG 52.96 = DSM 107014 TaxID=1521640 RepID=A0A941GUW8_9CHRO|nr:NADAR family protein [Gomphosphaeria aponina SAG 52.96 = DSM 107014]
MTIYFYSPREQPYGFFSNFSRHGFELDGFWWSTNEHYYQAQKFVETDQLWFEKILAVKTPQAAAKMGRSPSHPLPTNWELVKDSIMEKGVLQKFTTHPEIKQLLIATGSELIVEKSPRDYYWGGGKDGTGQNKLGEILMKVRDKFR